MGSSIYGRYGEAQATLKATYVAPGQAEDVLLKVAERLEKAGYQII